MTAIVLDDLADFVEITVNGHTFTVDAFDALDVLMDVDKQHREDPKDSRAFLETLAGLIVSKWGAPRCSTRQADHFYSIILGRVDELKKKNGTTLKSPTGSTASTQPAGRKRGGGRSSSTSRGSRLKRNSAKPT